MFFTYEGVSSSPHARRHAADTGRSAAEQREYSRKLLLEPLTEADYAAWRAAAQAALPGLLSRVSTVMPARRSITKIDVPDAYMTASSNKG